MPGRPTVFEILRTQQDPAADAALLAALDGADTSTAHAIVETLLTRGTHDGLLGLVESFHLLDEELRQMLLIDWQRLFSVLREAGHARTDQVRVNVLEIIRRACIYRAAYLVESGLRHRSPTVRQVAASTLCFLAEELLRTAPVPVRDADLQKMTPDELRGRMHDLENYAEDRRQVVAAIEGGLGSFDLHHQPQIVEIALWFLDEMGQGFWSILTMPGSRVAQVVTNQLRKALTPRLVPFVMAALSFSEFRPLVAKALADGTDALFLEEWLKQSWRLAQPKVGRGMAALKDLACTFRHATELLALPARSQRHLARWIVSTGLGPREKIELLKGALGGGSLPTRRSALWMLTALNDPHVKDVLGHVDDAEDPELGRIARRELAIRSPGEVPLSRLMQSKDGSHERADAASREPQPLTFDQYWRAFDGMDERQRVEAGKQMLHHVPLAHASLARHLQDPQPLDRVRAVRIITCLGLVEAFQDKLFPLCHDPSPEIRSAAVAALGPLNNAVSRRLVKQALNDEDTRVQANAVEAIAASGAESATDDLLKKLASPDNRVQANAVKVLLQLGVRDAAETLLKMLEHDSRLHRMSALWLIERMGLFTLASRVAGMAGEDPDPAVRKRAGSLAGNLSPSPCVPNTEHPTTQAAVPAEVVS